MRKEWHGRFNFSENLMNFQSDKNVPIVGERVSGAIKCYSIDFHSLDLVLRWPSLQHSFGGILSSGKY
uniref:Uncharacterized protein n=1 Tax=Romanomermis culicivorax TaxID=13658 RepID=A0A915JYW9_ROMCU